MAHADPDRIAHPESTSVIRSRFIQNVVALSLVGLAPAAALAAAGDAVSALPYDKTIGLKMRVLDGPDFDLVKYRGYVVWINVFATWCPPCNEEQPEIVRIAKRYYGRGLRVIAMDSQETDDAVRIYRKKYGIPYPIAMDVDGFFAQALQKGKKPGVYFPAHLLITPQGYLSYFGVDEIDTDTITSRIEGLLTLVDPAPSSRPAGMPPQSLSRPCSSSSPRAIGSAPGRASAPGLPA
jgi:thiol-disulfide isomerase/thioredoxin